MRNKYPIFNSIPEFSEHLGMERFSPEYVKAGEWSRFPRMGRGSRDTACAVTEFSSGWLFGANWETGAKALYTATGRRRLSAEERTALTLKMAQEAREGARKRVEKLEQARAMGAAFFASGIASRLMTYDTPNPYLMRKSLGAVDAKLWTCAAEDASRFMATWLRRPCYSLTAPGGKPLKGPCLVVPIGKHPNACGIQLIDAEGHKTFLKGSVMKGRCWYAHDESVYQTARRIAVGEGVATVLSINRVYGWPVVAAMNCGNLEAVSVRVKRDYPSVEIIIISDKDEGGAGQRYAQEACKAVGGRIIEPMWTADEEARYPLLREMRVTDFNDYLVATQRLTPRLATVEGKERDL